MKLKPYPTKFREGVVAMAKGYVPGNFETYNGAVEELAKKYGIGLETARMYGRDRLKQHNSTGYTDYLNSSNKARGVKRSETLRTRKGVNSVPTIDEFVKTDHNADDDEEPTDLDGVVEKGVLREEDD